MKEIDPWEFWVEPIDPTNVYTSMHFKAKDQEHAEAWVAQSLCKGDYKIVKRKASSYIEVDAIEHFLSKIVKALKQKNVSGNATYHASNGKWKDLIDEGRVIGKIRIREIEVVVFPEPSYE